MPKVLPLSAIERKKQEFTKWIRGKRAEEGVSQAALGQAWNVSQAGACIKVKTGNMSYSDLVIMFRELHATDEEILKVMKW